MKNIVHEYFLLVYILPFNMWYFPSGQEKKDETVDLSCDISPKSKAAGSDKYLMGMWGLK